MDRLETLKILAILRVAYPNFYKSMDADEYDDTVLLWADLFQDDPFMLVSAAVKTLIVTDEKGYPLHIGAVKSTMAKLTEPPTLTEMEAWNLVRTKLSAYATHEDFWSCRKQSSARSAARLSSASGHSWTEIACR